MTVSEMDCRRKSNFIQRIIYDCPDWFGSAIDRDTRAYTDIVYNAFGPKSRQDVSMNFL